MVTHTRRTASSRDPLTCRLWSETRPRGMGIEFHTQKSPYASGERSHLVIHNQRRVPGIHSNTLKQKQGTANWRVQASGRRGKE